MKNDPNKNGMAYASHTLPSLHLVKNVKRCRDGSVCDRRFGRLANYRCGTPVMISINANSLVVDENTRE